MQNPLVEEIFAALHGLGTLRSKAMFGGHGLYCDEVFFGLLAEDVLYFKVDAENRESYLEHDTQPFLPGLSEPTEQQMRTASYYEVPAEVQERPAAFQAWAREALAAARRKDALKKPSSRRAARPRDPGKQVIRRMRNLGPSSAAWLKSVGISTRADLERHGSVGAYARMLEAGVQPNLNLLYAMEAALMELNILHLPAVIKDSLRERCAGLARRKKA